jgi:hypothetical protein
MHSPPENTECEVSEQKTDTFPDLKIVRMKSVGNPSNMGARKQLGKLSGNNINNRGKTATREQNSDVQCGKTGNGPMDKDGPMDQCFILKYKHSDSSCTIKAPESNGELKTRAANIVRAVTAYQYESGQYALQEQLLRSARWAKEVLGKEKYESIERACQCQSKWVRMHDKIKNQHPTINNQHREEEEKLRRDRMTLVDGLAMVAQIRKLQREMETEREEEEGMKLD